MAHDAAETTLEAPELGGTGNGRLPDGQPDVRRLTRQGKRRKEELLAHASRLFSERGYAETRVIDIVKAAGVAKGLFYWYFPNKEAVFRELLEENRRKLRREQGSAGGAEPNPLVRIRRGSEATVRFLAERPRIVSLYEDEGAKTTMREDYRRSREVHLNDAARHIEEGIHMGIIRDEEPKLLAWGVLSTVSSYARLARTAALPVELDEVVAFTGRTVVHSLANSDDDARIALSVTAG